MDIESKETIDRSTDRFRDEVVMPLQMAANSLIAELVAWRNMLERISLSPPKDTK